MSNQPLTPEQKRRLENIQAVMEHQHSSTSSSQASQEDSKESSSKSSTWGQRLKTWGPIGLAAFFLLSKLKYALLFLQVTKLSTLVTMFLAIWVYAQLWGASFAVGFVLLIFVHELGHAVAMRLLGIRAGAPIFIPFIGAVIAMKDKPKNAYVEALVGIGGPALGTLGAIFCLVVGWVSNSQFWYALASTGFLINLFNMLPISPLDGGRIAGVIHRWAGILGLVIGGLLFWKIQSPILLIILALGAYTLYRQYQAEKKAPEQNQDYFQTSQEKRITIGISYFGLLFVMAYGMWIADQKLQDLFV